LYGGGRLAKNVERMNGEKVNIYFKISWYVITPVFILIIWILNWYQYEPITYGKYEFPIGAQIFGWCIALISIASIPIAAIHTVYTSSAKTLKEVLFIFGIFF
jgi:hypothetical protein